MKKFIRDYFHFSRQEMNGLFGLILLILLLYLLPILYRSYSRFQTRDAQELQAIEALILLSDSVETQYSARAPFARNERNPPRELFAFDPNTLSSAGWQRLGLSVKQAQSIVNYRAKGGRFYTPKDLQKMYTISPEMYRRLEKYVHIPPEPEKERGKFSNEKLEKITTPVMVDLNRTDTIGLTAVRGIGMAFARRILRYRARLGGFVSITQLREVYGIDSVKFAEIADQLVVDAEAIRKINVNTATFDDLKGHPYLSYKQINALIWYRKQHGNYADMNALKKVTLLSEQTLEKIKPYLAF